MFISLNKKFSKQRNKAPLEVKKAFAERLRLFMRDPFNPALNNHSLQGKFKDMRSINITGDWRALYSERSGSEASYSEDESNQVIIFELLGTHSKLYK